ncbi:MAG: hypothetical protein V7724_03760 [Sediminicola sp.]
MKKNLDQLFQENFKEFQELPSERVWKSLEASLDRNENKRRAIPIWWSAAGVAALLAVILLIADPFGDAEINPNQVTDTENTEPQHQEVGKNPLKNSGDAYTNTPDESTNPGRDVVNSDNENGGQLGPHSEQLAGNPSRSSTTKKSNDKSQKDIHPLPNKETFTAYNAGTAKETEKGLAMEEGVGEKENPLSQKSSPIDEIGAFEKGDETVAETEPTDPKKKSIYDVIKEQEEEAEEIAESNDRKWSLEPTIAPVYFNGFGEGSPVASSFSTNSKTGNVNLSYGVLVSYEVSKKVRIRSGLNKVDFGYDTNDVNITSSFWGPEIAATSNINYNRAAENLVVTSNSPTAKPPSQPLDVTAESPSRNGSMVQQFGYVEIPMEINYTLLDRKFGIHLVGGLSSLFLTNNDILLESEGMRTTIGEASNINSVNFSTNVGFGLNYKFTPKVRLNIEPVFKYQLNTFSETAGSFQPFSVGVYSGFSFRF